VVAGLTGEDGDLVRRLSSAFVDGLREVLGEKLFALYFYGAVAFPETQALGDIDFHAILGARLSDGERRALVELHERLASDFPPLGGELDGYYLLLEDAGRITPPRDELRPDKIDESFALHCAHLRAGRSIVLCGPDPRDVYPEPSWTDLEAALDGELDYVTRHLDQYPDYCILNLCRLLYSFEARDAVTSKAAAAAWARRKFSEWERPIALALESYAHLASPREAETMKADLARFHAFAQDRIAALREKASS
jgi:hypothetical protein